MAEEPVYIIWITTGDQALGGTDSNVYVMLFGKNGQTDWIYLPPEDIFSFEEGSTDKFYIVAPDVGDLAQVCVAHDASADSGWYVARVKVQHIPSQKEWTIEFNEWVGEEEAGRRVVCEAC
jgi:lipoxygenase homology domain-containing protein 1